MAGCESQGSWQMVTSKVQLVAVKSVKAGFSLLMSQMRNKGLKVAHGHRAIWRQEHTSKPDLCPRKPSKAFHGRL